MVDALWLFGNEEHADGQVVIVEEGRADADADAAGSAGPRTRKRARDESSSAESSREGQVVLPIHKLIVMSASEFFKARLSAWQSTSDGEPCRVVLHVPPGQLELGRRFVRALYEDAPSFENLSIEQQLQLLQLARRYGAPKVAKAAAAAAGMDVTDMSPDGLAWAAVRAAYPVDLDYSASEEDYEDDPPPPAPALQQYANDALQELFGDLEAVWASADDGSKQRDLLWLPHAALVALLADERTLVASENVVVHTIKRWLATKNVAPSSEESKELLALVRAVRLTPHYARTVFCESALAKAHLSKSRLTLASMAPLVGDYPLESLHDCKHWCLPARPRSALADAVVLEWSPRLAELEAYVTALPAGGEGRSANLDGPKGVVWQGWPLHLRLGCRRSASGSVELRFSLAAEPPCSAAGASIEHALEALAASGGTSITCTPKPGLYTAGDKSWGPRDFFVLGAGGDGGGPPKDWAGVEAALRAKRLVHGGRGGGGGAAHLKLRCKVTRLE
jgi:hypothetical protein